jgi:adenylate cyclase
MRLAAERQVGGARVVIVDIDEASLKREGHWPWSRDKLARLVKRLFDDYGADTVAFDVVFAERDESHELAQLEALAGAPGDRAWLKRLKEFERKLDRDRLFAEALRGRRAVLGYHFNPEPHQSGALPEPVYAADTGMNALTRATPAAGYTANLQVLQDSARGGFFSNPLTDEDGVMRRVPLFIEYEGALYESLALATVRTHLDAEIEPIVVEASGDYPPLEGLRVGNKEIPLDENAAALIPFRGRQGSFPYLPAHEVLNGKVSNAGVLKGSIVLIGTTAVGLMDLRATPVQSVYPGVEVHANTIAGILDGRMLYQPAYVRAAEWIVIAVAGVSLSLLLPLTSPLVSTVAGGAAVSAVLLAAQYIWTGHHLVLPLASTLALIAALFGMNMIWGFFTETRAKHALHRRFGQYVPPEIVEEMSHNPERYSLAGEKRALTVLFSDVRGFTTLSEGLDPKELSALMNAFLTPFTRIVHETGGTIDKYMGDAMMAFWGAPLSVPDHASRALDASLRMLEALKGVNADFRNRGWPEIGVGIGINTGEMNVGNMGSEFRMAYTVMGDAVNLGSRLEGLTRSYGVNIIVSDSTMHAAPDFVYRELDRVRVKGKNEPVVIYEVIGVQSRVHAGTGVSLERYREALQAYRERRFADAEVCFADLAADDPACGLYSLYLERLRHYQSEPPPRDWDGVYTFKTK